MMVMVWGNDDDSNDDDHDEVGLPWGWIEKVHGCPLWPSLDTPRQARSPDDGDDDHDNDEDDQVHNDHNDDHDDHANDDEKPFVP